MAELNKVSALWADDDTVMRNLRDFFADKSGARLVVLLRSLARTTPLEFEQLSDTDILNIFRALRENSESPTFQAAFAKCTNSVLVTAMRCAFSRR